MDVLTPLAHTNATTRQWHSHILYATATAVAMVYNISVRLRYVAVAQRNLCTPQKTIPPIAIFLVVEEVSHTAERQNKAFKKKHPAHAIPTHLSKRRRGSLLLLSQA
jgi:hypothetical protein